MGFIKVFLYLIGLLFLLFSAIPFVRKDYWAFRIFEYPRFQKFVVTVAILIAFLWFCDSTHPFDLIFVSLLGLNAIYLGKLIFPYTPFAPTQIKNISAKDEDFKNSLRLLVANVYQDNKNASGILQIIRANDPDLILLVETNERWKEALKELQQKYREQVLYTLENTYGMLFFSKYPIEKAGVKFLVDDDKPSIHTYIIFPSGKKIRFFGIHPAPPAPHHNAYTTDRDKELMIVAKMTKQQPLPTIVTGDLNDVAWSYTTDLFMNISHLLDPRRGRGMYNTFNAKYPFLRWPLDHIFCSKHFKLIHLKRLKEFGSDHFPLLIALQLTEDGEVEQKAPKASKEEKQLADKKLHKKQNK